MKYNTGDMVLVLNKYIGEVILANEVGVLVDVFGKGKNLYDEIQLNHIDLKKLIVDKNII